MELVRIFCKRCGGDLTTKGDEYFCPSCGSRYEIKMEESVQEKANNLFAQKELEALSKIRKNLFALSKEEFIDVEKIKGCCQDIHNYQEDDYYATFYETLLCGSLKEIKEYVNSHINENPQDAKEMLDILLRRAPSLKEEILLSLNRICERDLMSVDAESYAEYNGKIIELSKKLQSNIYEVDYPRTVFVAYSSKDYSVVEDLVSKLELQGITCFVALRNLPHGAISDYKENLQKAIISCDYFLLVSTKNARRRDCDAFTVELPYAKSINKKLIEYIIDAHNPEMATDKITEKYFGSSEWCYSIDDIVERLFQTDIEPVSPKQTEEVTNRQRTLKKEQPKVEEKSLLEDVKLQNVSIKDIQGDRYKAQPYLDNSMNEAKQLRYDDSEAKFIDNVNVNSLKPMEQVVFGAYPVTFFNLRAHIIWYVLENNPDDLLLLSRYVLDFRPSYEKEKSDYEFDYTHAKENFISKWLDGTFINIAFTYQEKECLLSNHLDGSSHPQKVFLLSEEEVTRYFANKEDARALPTIYAFQGGTGFYSGGADYLTRSVTKEHQPIYVRGNGGISSTKVTSFEGIRPVIRLSKSSYLNYLKNDLSHFMKRTTYDVNQFPIMQTVKFGRFQGAPIDWFVGKQVDGETFLISKQCIINHEFTQKKNKGYKKSTLRAYLIKELYSDCFNQTEKNNILVKKSKDTNTKDPIFIPSLEEIHECFRDNDEKIASLSAYAKSNVGYMNEGVLTQYWVRDGKNNKGNFATVCNYNGSYDVNSFEDKNIGVRIAIWIKSGGLF